MMPTAPVPQTPEERRDWLKIEENRDSVLNGGAGILFYFGDTSDPAKVSVILSHRHANVGEGMALFGGLCEKEDFVPGNPVQTAKNNAVREVREEWEEILGYEPSFDTTTLTPLFTGKDDVFFIQNGKGFSVDFTLHACRIDDTLLETLFPGGITQRARRDDDSKAVETEKIEKTPLLEALKLENAFHYPHEYLALWTASIKIFGFDKDDLIKRIGKEPDFGKIAARMDISLAELEGILTIKKPPAKPGSTCQPKR